MQYAVHECAVHVLVCSFCAVHVLFCSSMRCACPFLLFFVGCIFGDLLFSRLCKAIEARHCYQMPELVNCFVTCPAQSLLAAGEAGLG